jgi:hypothetical protein
MAKVKKTKEILVTTENKVGMLKELSSLVSRSGANITAICAYGEAEKASFMLVADDSQKAVQAIKGKGYSAEEKDVLEVRLDNKVGELEKMSGQIAQAGIDINYIYGTVTEKNAPATLIMSSKDDGKVLEILK